MKAGDCSIQLINQYAEKDVAVLSMLILQIVNASNKNPNVGCAADRQMRWAWAISQQQAPSSSRKQPNP